MLKIMTIVGTRPEIIKMARVISELDKHTNHILVHTGQNYDYELNQIFFNDLNIRKPNYFLEAVGETTAKSIALIIEKADEVLELEKPDAVLLYGDTNSCLSVIVAKRRKIPVFHMEAGNRCFDQRVPEELNRKVLDHLSDVNFVLTEHARRYLINEGVRPELIFKTGSHMNEVLEFYMPRIKNSNIIDQLQLEKHKYFVVSIHREENVDDISNLHDLINSLNAIGEKYNYPIIVSTHPRTQKRINEQTELELNSNIKFLKPFGFYDYIMLQLEAYCILSDSGTITEEASILKLPAITIRNTHERPEGMDAGTLIMTGLKKETILDAIDVIVSHHKDTLLLSQTIDDYGTNIVSKQILRVVLSYVGYINRVIWSK
ncbi:UDP-N-acetylglucosamine 2-epimerase (non-hydrolyzing) [Alphaproteobacteria bacterium]|nr:UDP-N-acetylglucosamine 2-epimerase (non-hydrolyzing) [Alphaproteobacteria bacterium]MDC1023103.1 UDP-N-acetylglucosamine 2-epimerase (non-hydrolyzing) [Alphaproteobacteria bacterium]